MLIIKNIILLASLATFVSCNNPFPDIKNNGKFFYAQMHAGGLEGTQDGKVVITKNDTSYQYMDVLVSNGTNVK